MNEIDESDREILDSIDKVQVIAVEDENLNARINLHDEFYQRISEKGKYEELMVVRNNDESVTVFGRQRNYRNVDFSWGRRQCDGLCKRRD